MVLRQGVFVGHGNKYEERHGGITMISQKYYFFYFQSNKVFKKEVWIYLDKPFSIEDHIAAFVRETKEDIPEIWKGSFVITDNILEISLVFNSQVFKEEYTILSPEIIIDKNLIEHKFVK